jgi:hypothetical protein
VYRLGGSPVPASSGIATGDDHKFTSSNKGSFQTSWFNTHDEYGLRAFISSCRSAINSASVISPKHPSMLKVLHRHHKCQRTLEHRWILAFRSKKILQAFNLQETLGHFLLELC